MALENDFRDLNSISLRKPMAHAGASLFENRPKVLAKKKKIHVHGMPVSNFDFLDIISRASKRELKRRSEEGQRLKPAKKLDLMRISSILSSDERVAKANDSDSDNVKVRVDRQHSLQSPVEIKKVDVAVYDVDSQDVEYIGDSEEEVELLVTSPVQHTSQRTQGEVHIEGSMLIRRVEMEKLQKAQIVVENRRHTEIDESTIGASEDTPPATIVTDNQNTLVVTTELEHAHLEEQEQERERVQKQEEHQEQEEKHEDHGMPQVETATEAIPTIEPIVPRQTRRPTEVQEPMRQESPKPKDTQEHIAQQPEETTEPVDLRQKYSRAIAKRNYLAASSLKSLCSKTNSSQTSVRVGLSKRTRIDQLHGYLKKRP